MEKRDIILDFIGGDIEYFFDKAFDDALIGYVQRAGDDPRILYDKNKLIQLLKDKPLCLKKEHLYFTKASLEEIEKIEDGKLLLADGFNDAIIGYAETYDSNCFVIYDENKCIKILDNGFIDGIRKENPKMTEEEVLEESNEVAVEFFYFNTADAYMGEKTPGFATIIPEI